MQSVYSTLVDELEFSHSPDLTQVSSTSKFLEHLLLIQNSFSQRDGNSTTLTATAAIEALLIGRRSKKELGKIADISSCIDRLLADVDANLVFEIKVNS